MFATQVERLYVLLCGFEILPKTVSTRDRGSRFIMSEPVSAYLLQTTAGYVLVDTGLDADRLRDPESRRRAFTDRGWDPPPIVNPEHELLVQLEQIGVAPGDIGHVVLTHMHADHTGNLKHFAHARISVQRREHEHAFAPDNTAAAWIRDDYDGHDLQWHLVEGDWRVVPGLQVIDTRGHTPGHQSVVVTLPSSGTLVLVGDSGDLAENFADEVLPGESVDDEAALAAIRRQKQIAQERGGQLFLAHDPVFIQTVRLAPEWYD